MLYNKEIVEVNGEQVRKVSYYAKWTGFITRVNKTKSFYIDTDRSYLRNIQLDDGTDIYYNDYNNECRVSFEKKYVNNKRHITSQITSYQRLNMLEQLLKMDVEKIIRVCVDGCYYFDHEYENKYDILNGTDKVFSSKEDMTFKNLQSESYLSNMNDTEYIAEILQEETPNYNPELPEAEYISRPIAKSEFHGGVGS